jgi:hypothetical protein
MRRIAECVLLAVLLSGCGGGDPFAGTDTTTTPSDAAFLDEPVWTGAFATESERLANSGERGLCSGDTWRGLLSFAVDRSGAISGQGRADLRVSRSCPNAGRALLFRVSGRSDAGLRLRLTWTETMPANETFATGMAALMMHGPRLEDPGGPLLTMRKTDACHADAEFAMETTIFEGSRPRPVRVRTRFELICG